MFKYMMKEPSAVCWASSVGDTGQESVGLVKDQYEAG
jgi:hypothetical protein